MEPQQLIAIQMHRPVKIVIFGKYI